MERNELINDIQKLQMKRDRLLAQVKEAEQWESVAWDSFNALADHINAMEKKRKIAQNYWDSSQREINYQFDFVVDQANRVKKVLAKKQYELLESEIEQLMQEVCKLADVLGLEIDALPLDFPFFDLPVEEISVNQPVSDKTETVLMMYLFKAFEPGNKIMDPDFSTMSRRKFLATLHLDIIEMEENELELAEEYQVAYDEISLMTDQAFQSARDFVLTWEPADDFPL